MERGTPETCTRIVVDEIHLNVIVMAIRLTNASETHHRYHRAAYIDRFDLYPQTYIRPTNEVAKYDRELLSIHRNSKEIADTLNEIYNGVYSSKTRVHSLTLKKYKFVGLPKVTYI